MLLEQVYLAFIYILFKELAMVTLVAVLLLIALALTIRKLSNKKTHFCLVNRDAFIKILNYIVLKEYII